MPNTDRFYDAPKGPQVQPDVEMPRRARYEISSSPDMFGGLIAKGLSQVGQGLTDAYNVYGQVAADQATNNFLGKLTSLRTDFEQTRGQDTINSWRGEDGSPGYPEKAQAAFDEARATVPPGHQNAFDNVARRYLFASNSAGNSHFRTQSGEWAKTVATTKDQEAINSISSHPNDDATFDANVDSMAHAAVAQAQIAQGIPDFANADQDGQNILRNVYNNAVGRAWYARIEAVRPSNPQQALQWQKDHAEELGKLGPQVQNQLRSYMGQSQTTEWDKQAEAETAGRGNAVATSSSPVSDVYFRPDTLHAYKARTAQIENPGGNPLATSSAGATGKYQFMPATWRTYGGGGDIHGDQEAAMDRLTMDNAKTMSYALGRAPQLWELYLGHQQGPMGAYHLLTEPNRRAGDIVGNAAIRQNGGDPNAPASAFTAMWRAKFGNMSGGPVYAGGGQPGDVTIAAGPHMQFTGPPSDPLIRDLMATPGAPSFTPASPGNGPDQGGSGGPPPGQPAGGSEGQPVQPAAYQPMVPVGGGGGGAPDLKQPGMETVPPQPSPFISPEERAYHEKDDAIRRKMLWVINNPNIPEGGTPTAPGKAEMLHNYERDRAALAIGYHQDAEYRRSIYNQTRSSIAQTIDKGDYLGALKATNDALAQDKLDEQGWATMNAVIRQRSGDPDVGSLGPGMDNVVRGIIDGKITSPEGIDRMYADHQIGWVGRQRALDVLKEHIGGEREGIHVQELHVLDTAKQWFRWEMPGPTPGTSIANPNGDRMFGNFLKQFYTDMGSQKTQDPGLLKFDYFDGDKLAKMLRDKYPERARNMEQGEAGMSKVSAEQAAAMEQNWTMAPHPAAPPNTSPPAWNAAVANPAMLKGGVQMPHPYWDKILRTLVADPSPSTRQFFDRNYGPEGQFATGRSADDLLRDLGQKRPAEAAEEERSQPAPRAPAATIIKPHPGDAPFQVPSILPRVTPAEQLPDEVRRMFPELNR